MNGDEFISTSKNIQERMPIEDANNFFMQNGVSVPNDTKTEIHKHLNDYDSNILQEDAYRDINDEIFKLEYKISRIEDEIADIDKQIQTAKEIYDYYHENVLTERKAKLKERLRILTDSYNEASLSAKISSGLTSKIKDKFLDISKKVGSIGETLITKIPGKFASIIEIRNSLNKLENINKSVDELMNSRYPYGEAAEKYTQLSKYIARANSIQSEIYKFMKD